MITFVLDAHTLPARVVRHAPRARRLRLEIPSLLGDRHLGPRLESLAETWPGIVDAHADPRSGRMLLHYAEGAPLLHALREEPSPAAPTESETRPRHRTPPARPRANRSSPHALPLPTLFEQLGAGPQGLTSREATRRLRHHGPNLLEEADVRSPLRILAAQVANVPMEMLLAAAGGAVLLGDAVDAGAILVVVGLNAGIGYRIERGNQRVITSWRKLEGGFSQVVRDGVLRNVPSADLVPGDLLLIRAGDVIPADARVIDAHRLSVDEAPLTGESEPQRKRSEPAAAEAPLAERTSMLYAGTAVASGHGRALITATGANTELARVRELVETAGAPEPPLARRMESMGNRVAILSAAAAGLSATASLLHGKSPIAVARSAVALAVAALPEGLPLVATSALVRSMQRLHDHGMVVRRVAAAETLGGVTVICTDKTGTLTQNEMRLERIVIGDRSIDPKALRAHREKLFEDPVSLLLAAALLNSDVDVLRTAEKGLALSGSATERALVDAAHGAGLDGAELRRTFPRRRLLERHEEVHYVVSIHDDPAGGLLSLVKGAPEQVIDLCDRDRTQPLDAKRKARLRARADSLAAEGLRVLALAWGRAPPPAPQEFLGFVALRDPLRPGAAETIARARAAGIRTVILTGDHRQTASAVAKELRLQGEIRDASSLDRAALIRNLDDLAVLARVTPEDKVAIVRALREQGEIVAMAGDGINDAPALKAADVGVAVGARASDLARQVADIVMAGEDLRGILAAVGEGRIVQDNLRRALRFLFATNLSELGLMLAASLVGARDPLTPTQLLWINLLTDTLPALALALEPGDPDVLDRPPAPKGAPLLRHEDTRAITRHALLLAGVGAAGLALGGPPIAFGALAGAQLSYAAVCRAPQQHRRHTAERAAADRRFAGMVGGALGVQLLGLTAPPLRAFLSLPAPTPLSLGAFAAGVAIPWFLRGAAAPATVVRYGPAYLEIAR